MQSPAARRLSLARGGIAAGAALIGGACLLIAGCASGNSASGASSSPGFTGAHARAAGSAEAKQAGGTAGVPAAPGAAAQAAPAGQAALTALPAPAGQAIIYTASMTVRSKDVSAAASLAAQITAAAGGYVASESSNADRAHPAEATVDLRLKIPAAGYPAVLSSLSSRLGTRITLSEQAQDVTQTVADVTSRVASAKAAIAQLRALLARAGSVSDLLNVQDEINQQEASLEALQAQQRALGHETSYATVSLTLLSRHAPAARRHHPAAGGFTGGLAAGWRALRAVLTGLLTGLGAILPFALPVAVLGYLGWRGRRWLLRRRTPAAPAG